MPKLIKVVPSTNPKKKYDAHFISHEGRKKKTSFGAKGMDDYTKTKDKEQRKRYRERHKKDLSTNDPTRAGFLSYYILWGNSTSRQENIKNYSAVYNNIVSYTQLGCPLQAERLLMQHLFKNELKVREVNALFGILRDIDHNEWLKNENR